MSRSKLVIVILLAMVAFAGSAQAQLVEGNDPKAKPIHDALETLKTAIVAGDLGRAKAAYSGDKADVELLEAYVKAVKVARSERAAADAKFGADPKRTSFAFDRAVERMAVYPINTVIFSGDDAASSSADSPLGVGIEFARVNGVWKVRSLASRPNTPEQHIAPLNAYIAEVEAATQGITNGSIKTAAEAERAMTTAAEHLAEKTWGG